MVRPAGRLHDRYTLPLTTREIANLATGLSNPDIAERFTVAACMFRARMCIKLGVSVRGGGAALLRRGWAT